MAWGSVSTTTGIAEGGSTAWFELQPYEVASVQVERELLSGTTDTMIVSVYSSPDNGTTVDDNPVLELYIDADTPPQNTTFAVSANAAGRYFRITMTATGSTDTVTMTARVTMNGGLTA